MVRGDEYVVKRITYNTKGQVASFSLPSYVVNTSAFAYDTRGNMTTYPLGARTYTHDNKVKIGQTRTSDGRVIELVNGQLRTTLDYDDQGRVLWADRTNGTGNARWDVEHDPWGINALRVDNVQTAYQYYNQRGVQLAAWVVSLNQVQENDGFDPYGEPVDGGVQGSVHISMFNPFLYGGRDQTIYSWGAATGVWHTLTMGEREYSPALQGFLQADPEPSRQAETDTAYSYVGYDPINHVDPDGRAAQSTLAHSISGDPTARKSITFGSQFVLSTKLVKKSNPYMSMRVSIKSSMLVGADAPLLPISYGFKLCLKGSDDKTRMTTIGCKDVDATIARYKTVTANLDTNVATGPAFHRTRCGGRGSKNYPNATYFADAFVSVTAGVAPIIRSDVMGGNTQRKFGRTPSYGCLNRPIGSK